MHTQITFKRLEFKPDWCEVLPDKEVKGGLQTFEEKKLRSKSVSDKMILS